MTNEEIERFFFETPVRIAGNVALREPQVEGYAAVAEHFAKTTDPGYVQMPVGCGKTGLMGLSPFAVSRGRVLIVVPNVTIRATVFDELDISKVNCFFRARGVFIPKDGPYVSVLKPGANIHDCDNAHVVIANIQQFAGSNNRWYERLPRDYFRMILVDEGHHNVAESWRRLFDYFDQAIVVSYTATPMRSDGQVVTGQRLYHFSYTRSMLLGYISPIDAIYVAPERITFTAKGETRTYALEEVLEMREHDWFSRGIALSDICNRNIVQASIRQLNEVGQFGTPRQIIAVACSIRHAMQIKALYHELGIGAEVLHSEMTEEEQEKIKASLTIGAIDAIVQVQMLGEGFDLGTLSVAAVFRPYRSLSPYIQFIGRILRLADKQHPESPGNQVYVVSHVGLNDERWWKDFTNFDKDDREFFAEYLGVGETIDGDESSPRMTLRPFMRVLNETVTSYLQRGYLKQVDQQLVLEFLNTLREKGFDPLEFGLTEEVMLRRLQFSASQERQVPAMDLPAQPQRQKEALRVRAQQEARSIADTVINRTKLRHGGKELLRYFGQAGNNVSVLIPLAMAAQNRRMKIESGGRDQASLEQFQSAIDASADIVDELTALVQTKMKQKET
jgi:DNA repair protein RadD